MELRGRDALEQFAREHHVHYAVEAEAAVPGRLREVVGFDVRLFATHGEAKLEAPACPRCVELLSGLRSFAEGVIAEAGAGAERWTEIVPDPAALYESTEVRGADEVALTVRVRRGASDRGEERAMEDPRLASIRALLGAVGVPQRS